MSPAPRQISRRQARVFAFQVLYGMRISGGTVGDALPGVLESLNPEPVQKAYGQKLVDLVLEHLTSIDTELEQVAKDWALDRMPVVDRAVLHVAMVEMLFCSDIPVRVAISEAIQIAHKYSTADSASFVNGVLDAFARSRGIIKPETNNDPETTQGGES